MADHLIAFIAARYDEAEALARAAARSSKGKWGHRLDVSMGGHLLDDAGEVVVYDEGSPTEAQFDHIAAVDPAHRLADIALKRAILAEHATTEGLLGRPICRVCWTVRKDGGPLDGDPYPCATVRQLGTEFSDHADYRSEWAP